MTQQTHRATRRPVTPPLAGALALVLLLTLAAPSAAAPPVTTTAATAAAPVEARLVTLVTGDRVLVERFPDEREAVTVQPGDRRSHLAFETLRHDGQSYVLPEDAAPLVGEVLDRELFNVTKLASYGYHDGVPVIATYRPAVQTRAAAPGATGTRELPSVNGTATTIDAGGQWWRSVRAGAPGAPATLAAGPLAGVDRLWLDEPATVSLDESVPMVGAPQAWAAGYDGTGITVAVLDTGIDADHPDLAGKVIEAENFTSEPDPTDGNGHGTHVASTVAGTGAASGGGFAGVAPGAELLNGKVCNSFGSCLNSQVISGMEWAAPRADLVSVSIGTRVGSDGTDPMSQAVNTLTAAHNVLFVVAAGNNGFQGAGSVASPGAADAALTVGSVDKDGELARTSGRGPRQGDFAVKPDITAPGVSIVAARAAGTSMGSPVDEFYTAASGTSMATPHVAGAAAILLQAAPDLGAAALKSVLASTAVPHPDLDVYRQGAGRLDVAAALTTPVATGPVPLDLGYQRWPHDDEPVTADVTYTNRTADEMILDLALEVTSDSGVAAPEAMLSVSPATLTVPPGQTLTAAVTLDVTEGETGLYGGHLTAVADAEVVTRTPVGFLKEDERYDLTVEGIARDGRPARSVSDFHVLEVNSTANFFELQVRFVDGVGQVRVPPGVYSVMGVINTLAGDNGSAQEWTMVGDPEFAVTGDTTVVLDARDATQVTVDTPAHPEAVQLGHSRLMFYREAEEFGSFEYSISLGDRGEPVYAVETESVTLGEFAFASRTRFGEPALAMSVVDPVDRMLHPWVMSGFTLEWDDDVELPVVWVGAGEPADYEGLDVTGAIVLSQRGLGPGHAERARIAGEHGAAALLVMNNVSGNYGGGASGAPIPAATISMEEGALLRDLLADGEVTMRMWGTRRSPYLYDLVVPEPDRIPGELHYRADPDELVEVVNQYHSGVADREGRETRHLWPPWAEQSTGFVTTLWAPHERTEYLFPGDTRYVESVWPAPTILFGQFNEAGTSYAPGERRVQTWLRSPLHPGVPPGEPVVRDKDTLSLALAEWFESGADRWGERYRGVDETAFRLFENGELVDSAQRPRGDFALSPDPAEYRLEVDVARPADWWSTSTETHTAWTIQSQRPGREEPEPVPMLLVDYDPAVDITNRALSARDRAGPPVLGLRVRHQPGVTGADVAGARLWISYDDGTTWREQPGRDFGDAEFQFILPPHNPRDTSGFLSLRVAAWDADGNRIEQEIIRAWRLAAG